MHVNDIFVFLIGFSVGLTLFMIFTNQITIRQNFFNKNAVENQRKIPISEQRKAVSLVQRLKILCFLPTEGKNSERKAMHSRSTWGRHCDRLIFVSVADEVDEGSKDKLLLRYVHTNFIKDFHWFFKGGEDTFAVIENMRFMLASYSSEVPIYFGTKLNKTSINKYIYNAKGSDYVMSRAALQMFNKKLAKNTLLCPSGKSSTEIWDISACFDKIGIYAGNSRDLIKRERFIPFTPELNIFTDPELDSYWLRNYDNRTNGLSNGCSNYSVAYHYIAPKHMYELYYLVYRLRVYGIEHQYPPPSAPKVIDLQT